MNPSPGQPPLELWAGIENTVNRVGDRYFDQCAKNGHDSRREDLDLFAELGVRTIRYPALWEKVAPDDLASPDWDELDWRMGRLEELGMTPIAGFVHHGSGPKYTALTDPEFEFKFARYAEMFGERFPRVMAYTPINEPLTTARFSGLYGFWYPHARDERAFLRILLNETRATVLAMREIRSVNPLARLVQTEDLGKTTSTAPLSYQAEFENHRRWLTFDLLCGRVTGTHPLRKHFVENGVTPDELDWFLENACPPDVIGINHYLLSNRFLDHRLERYPSRYHGGNGRERYADVGAVDGADAIPPSPYDVLREAWERYRLPVAVTEVHVNAHRESQMRWLHEIWKTAALLRSEGVDIRAVTVWSLLGSFDWDSLCTVCNGHYEPGVFDIRADQPKKTGLANMVRAIAGKGCFDHPVLDRAGWWQDLREARSAAAEAIGKKPGTIRFGNAKPRPVLVTGSTGTLGGAFARICEKRGLQCRAFGRGDLDIADGNAVRESLIKIKPWAVINAAGYVKVDDAESSRELCFRENVTGAETLASACADAGIPLVTFSSDLVFDGTASSPYLESHAPAPLNVYGNSKAEAEKRVLNAHDGALIVRSSAFFGPWDESNFVIRVLRRASAGHEVKVDGNGTVSPTYVPDLVNASLDLLIDGETGVWHLTNRGAVTWFDLARMAAEMAKIETRRIGRAVRECGTAAALPAYSVLGSEKADLLPSVEAALGRFFSELAVPWDRVQREAS